jgi:hypothetical protein
MKIEWKNRSPICPDQCERAVIEALREIAVQLAELNGKFPLTPRRGRVRHIQMHKIPVDKEG